MGLDRCVHLCNNSYYQGVNMSIISQWFSWVPLWSVHLIPWSQAATDFLLVIKD